MGPPIERWCQVSVEIGPPIERRCQVSNLLIKRNPPKFINFRPAEVRPTCCIYYILLSLIIIIILIIMILGFEKMGIGRYQKIWHHVMPAKDKDNRLSDEETKTVRSGGQPLSQEDSNAPTQLPSRCVKTCTGLEYPWDGLMFGSASSQKILTKVQMLVF